MYGHTIFDANLLIYWKSSNYQTTSLLIQILSGYTMAIIEEKIEPPKFKLLLCLFLSIFLLTSHTLLKDVYNIIKPKDFNSFQYNRLEFLKKYITNNNDVILSDNSSNFIIPAIAGKVIYSHFLKASSLVENTQDVHQREKDVLLFFSTNLQDTIRLQIVKKNKVNYILLKSEDIKFEILDFCTNHTNLIYYDTSWHLYKIKQYETDN